MAFDRGRGSSGKDDDRKWLEEANLAVTDGVAGWWKEGCGESPVLSREGHLHSPVEGMPWSHLV